MPAVADPAHALARSRFDRENLRPVRPALSGVEGALLALDGEDLLFELDRQLERVHDAAVVLQRFLPRGLLERRDEGQAADLQKFRRGEEHHVDRKLEDGIHQDALFDDRKVQPRALGGDAGGQSRGPGPYNNDVAYLHDG